MDGFAKGLLDDNLFFTRGVSGIDQWPYRPARRIVTGQALLVTGGGIAGLVNDSDLAVDVERVDVGGRLVTPGLIDIHTHGAGHTFNGSHGSGHWRHHRQNARRGVTSLLATTATAPIEDLVAAAGRV